MSHQIRYVGAVVRDHYLLMIKQLERVSGRSFWFVPGGHIESGENEDSCVQREVKEEANLDVKVVGLLLDEPTPNDSEYARRRTYLCEPLNGEAKPGYDPEDGVQERYRILEVKWFDLRDEALWDPDVKSDSITYPFLQLVRTKLGYLP